MALVWPVFTLLLRGTNSVPKAPLIRRTGPGMFELVETEKVSDWSLGYLEGALSIATTLTAFMLVFTPAAVLLTSTSSLVFLGYDEVTPALYGTLVLFAVACAMTLATMMADFRLKRLD